MVGYSSDIGDPFGNGSHILAVGSPGMDVEGRVYSSAEKFIQAGGVVLWDIHANMKEVARFTGDTRFSRFGSVVKVSQNYCFTFIHVFQCISQQKMLSL